jgi:hypothetical protein
MLVLICNIHKSHHDHDNHTPTTESGGPSSRPPLPPPLPPPLIRPPPLLLCQII